MPRPLSPDGVVIPAGTDGRQWALKKVTSTRAPETIQTTKVLRPRPDDGVVTATGWEGALPPEMLDAHMPSVPTPTTYIRRVRCSLVEVPVSWESIRWAEA